LFWIADRELTISITLANIASQGGHNAKGPENAFPRHFMDWLNVRYPCHNEDGSPGQHEIKKTHAQNSQTHFTHWSMVSEIDRIDLVFIEFCVNDHFLSDIPHALEEKGPIANNHEYIDLWYSEAIIRRLLLMRKPDPIAIVTFNAGKQMSSIVVLVNHLPNLIIAFLPCIRLRREIMGYISSVYES
jgi:hypothetical protein